ncbi:hypothetical protein [Sphaerotilus mobilis]|uniref:Alginate lyase n=1 Tax=Sphaerotilus mobilis TaxID=47994 RepID=A0A4Q7LTW1_9BURK|nr:hypothetical protein [Sphaerotilus mobilis]RZS58194.1 hypothetical protein EV685_0475 [Sphaerotilus mobilis]
MSGSRVVLFRLLVGALAIFSGASGALAQEATYAGALRGTSRCAIEYVPDKSATLSRAAALPKGGGVVWSSSELAVWRDRVDDPRASGLVLAPLEIAEYRRLQESARSLLTTDEEFIDALDVGVNRAKHGSRARDASLLWLLERDSQILAAVRRYLLQQIENPNNEFSAFCIKSHVGPVLDAKFFESSWLLRYAVTYDYVRSGLAASDRLKIENWMRRQALVLSAQVDWGLSRIFPGRLSSNYTLRSGPAAAPYQPLSRQMDSNGDCRVDSLDEPESATVYAYVGENQQLGPRLSVLSQYYNNRRAVQVAAFGLVGVVISDSGLIDRAKRYFGEWLAYAVWPDGSEGEYARNGDYCIPAQGLIYSAGNMQAQIIVASALARAGDQSLFSLSTRSGLWGSESSGDQPSKSLALAVGKYVDVRRGIVKRFMYETWRVSQSGRETTSLKPAQSKYMGSGRPIESLHEVGFWPAARYINVPSLVAHLTERMAGRNKEALASSGLGDLTDSFNAYPSIFLTRP